ncbi:hypothetical protein Pmani_031135 [Petrolisthes manimaculis]|uniref:Uncharacterized protein n=1 Tax=Petrolisthes manimaculis TaxID=1843537 RepID=A0AAE1NV99_9EUCA|nr:hypothetical protein Pmani_031135 [Petrolisthes manimaculis]
MRRGRREERKLKIKENEDKIKEEEEEEEVNENKWLQEKQQRRIIERGRGEERGKKTRRVRGRRERE